MAHNQDRKQIDEPDWSMDQSEAEIAISKGVRGRLMKALALAVSAKPTPEAVEQAAQYLYPIDWRDLPEALWDPYEEFFKKVRAQEWGYAKLALTCMVDNYLTVLEQEVLDNSWSTFFQPVPEPEAKPVSRRKAGGVKRRSSNPR